MINVETENLTMDSDDEFYRRLDASIHRYIAWFRRIIWLILNTRCNCWSLFKGMVRAITKLFFRRYIAIIVLVFSCFILFASFANKSGVELIITVIYCSSFICSSLLSLLVKRGGIMIAWEKISNVLKHQTLLPEFSHGNEQEAYQPADGYGTGDERQPLKSALESVMEPRPDSNSENSAGPSQSPDYTDDCFAITHIFGDNSDSDEPPRRPIVARISVDAIKAFGIPQVLGADSIRVLFHSSDESLDEVRDFESVVQVHRSDSYEPLNPCNDGFSSAGPSTVTNYESAVRFGSDLHSDLPYLDDD